MHRIFTGALMSCLLPLPAIAQSFDSVCQPVYDALAAGHSTDYASCEVAVAAYDLEDCEPPQTLNGAAPSSHLILAIDASGSMAGQVGGETKMTIARREALAFLQDIPVEVAVGLVVYGHTGNNQESGKAESCSSSELVHGFDTNRRALADTINGLTPTGWTPLAGVLDYAGGQIAAIETSGDMTLSPVVYLISDGEETCDGDPVTAARRLFDGGVRTTVNTIGFAVDAETEAQLAAIADVAGGIYYPAEDAAALRRQLAAIRDAEASLDRYQQCVNLNIGRIGAVYHNARVELAGCFQRNNPVNLRTTILNAMNRAERDDTPDAVCADQLRDYALFDLDLGTDWFSARYDPLTEVPLSLIADYRANAAIPAPD